MRSVVHNVGLKKSVKVRRVSQIALNKLKRLAGHGQRIHCNIISPFNSPSCQANGRLSTPRPHFPPKRRSPLLALLLGAQSRAAAAEAKLAADAAD